MTKTVQEAIEVLCNLPDDKAEIAAAAIINLVASQDEDVDREVAGAER